MSTDTDKFKVISINGDRLPASVALRAKGLVVEDSVGVPDDLAVFDTLDKSTSIPVGRLVLSGAPTGTTVRFPLSMANRHGMVAGSTGCHARGQEILMYDGTIKVVEDIVVGDRLMGPDSTPRTVLSLARGREPMVRIVPAKGESFVVNRSHILSLVRTRRWLDDSKAGTVVDTPVYEWEKWSEHAKHIHKLFRVGVDFPHPEPLPIDPYFMGLLLGDGALTQSPAVCKWHPTILAECERQAAKWGLVVRTYHKVGTGSGSYLLTTGYPDSGEGSNALINALRDLGLWRHTAESKFIPHIYKTASRNDRLALLAGLVDTDGACSDGCYDYTSASRRLAYDLAFVARSVGLAAYVNASEKSCQNGFTGTYWRVSVSGQIDSIPARIKPAPARKQIKDVLRTGFDIEHLPEDDYFGFALDGDRRYLMGDFTVTHNTGKTKTLQVFAEQLSWAGVPVFVADLKGDLSGLAVPGEGSPKVVERAKALDHEWSPDAPPVRLWSLTGRGGVPVRAQVERFGCLLLSRVLGLNETQSSVLAMIFKIAHDLGYALYSFDDVKAVLQFVQLPGVEKVEPILRNYGSLPSATLAVITRRMIEADHQGMMRFFDRNQTDVLDFIDHDSGGNGVVSVLDLTDVQNSPKLFSTAMLFLLRELYQRLPERGDTGRPELVFFFDEAHLLFADAPDALLEQIEQTVRLIRSKGVGVWFVTQTPADVPETVLAQLGNRVQHAVRAFTPKDRKAVKLTAENFPESVHYDVAGLLTKLAIGDALVSFLGPDGAPLPTALVRLFPPQSRMGPLTTDERISIRLGGTD